ncbi:hypothetical protein IWX49DRAFT_351848 [Phyllosticta citricarpa]
MASFLPPSFRLCLCGLCFLTWVHTAEASLILETQLPLCLSSTPDDTHRHDANGPSTIFCSVVSVSDQPTTATANCNYAKVAVRGRSVSQSAPPPTDPWRLICLACLLARTLGHGGHYCELVTYAVSQLPRKYSHVYVAHSIPVGFLAQVSTDGGGVGRIFPRAAAVAVTWTDGRHGTWDNRPSRLELAV